VARLGLHTRPGTFQPGTDYPTGPHIGRGQASVRGNCPVDAAALAPGEFGHFGLPIAQHDQRRDDRIAGAGGFDQAA
jgi:hypothetical protein